MIKLGTTFAEEVVTGLVYLGITRVDSVEYSGLMIDRGGLWACRKAPMFHCGDDLVGADLELQTDAAENLMALDLLIM